MSRQFWIYDNGEEPCLAFQDEENAKEIRRQDKIFYCCQVNPALDLSIEKIVKLLGQYDKLYGGTTQYCFEVKKALEEYEKAKSI